MENDQEQFMDEETNYSDLTGDEQFYFDRVEYHIDSSVKTLISRILWNFYPDKAGHFDSKFQRNQTKSLEDTQHLLNLIVCLIEDYDTNANEVVKIIRSKVSKKLGQLVGYTYETDFETGKIVENKVITCPITTEIYSQIDIMMNLYFHHNPTPTYDFPDLA